MASLQILSVFGLVMMGVGSSWAAPQHSNSSRPFHIEPRLSYDNTCKCGQKGSSRIVGGTNANTPTHQGLSISSLGCHMTTPASVVRRAAQGSWEERMPTLQLIKAFPYRASVVI